MTAAVHESVTCSDALYALHPGECGRSYRNNLAAAYLSVCLEHREAIILLARHGSASSAFALARSVYETCVRGLWALFTASDHQLKQLTRGVAPSFETVGKQLAKSETVGTLAQIRSQAWSPLSDYAHGGFRQLRNWLGEGEIGPQHPPEGVVNLLLLMDIYAYYAMFGLLVCAGQDGAPANDVYERLLAPRVETLKAG